MKSAEAILLQIQHDQQKHDLLAHRDILNLDTQTRLKHMTLHFLKYSGKLAIAKAAHDTNLLRSTLVDTFIICLATANALNVCLGDGIDVYARDLQSLSNELAKKLNVFDIFDCSLMEIVVIAGRMAKSIESTDHLERGNPRQELELLIVELSSIVLAISGKLELPLESSIKARWAAVEGKSIFSRSAVTA